MSCSDVTPVVRLLNFNTRVLVGGCAGSHAVKHLTSELIRRKQADQPLEDPDPGEKLERGRRTWKGLPKTEIVNPHAQVSREQLIKEKASRRGKDGKKREAPSNLTNSVTTNKTTVAHHAAVGARDDAYQVRTCPCSSCC